jgi:DNA polymerase III subunit gamma/tau
VSDPYQVLARKWRPRRFADVIGQGHVVRALVNALTQQYLHHAYLFTGTRGVGKTTIARLFAKCLNCETGVTPEPCGRCDHCREIDAGRFVDLLEVDAASRTKVEDTRDLLDNVPYAPTKGRFKVYLIDEVHMLSGHSFNALLKTLEEPPAHVKFLLATTDPQRLPATILSRCLQFHLFSLQPEVISAHLQTIVTQENIHFDAPALALLAKAAAGSVRDALSLLDQSIAFGNGQVLTEDVKNMLGAIDTQILYQILQTLVAQDANALLAHVARLAEQGVDFSRALADLLSLLHQIAVIQALPDAPAYLTDDQLHTFSTQMSREDAQLYYQIGLIGQRDLPWAPSARSGFEMTLLRMLAFIPQDTATVAPKPVSISAQKTTITKPATASADLPWHDLLKQLPLDGATKILAENCSLVSLSSTDLNLCLHPKQKPLLNQKHIDRIREAISHYYGRPIAVAIQVNAHQQDTPADLCKRRQESQQQAAEQAILSDPVVQHMMQHFDATLVKDSIYAKNELLLTTNKGEIL